MTNTKYVKYNATYDLVFKQMIKNKIVAKSITQDLLGVNIDINDIIYVDTENIEGVELKSPKFDVRFQVSKKLDLDYEMQKNLPFDVSLDSFRKRMLYYHSVLISSSLKKGESYNDMKTCIQIVFCNFPINYKNAVEIAYNYCEGQKQSEDKIIYIDLTKMESCDNIKFKKWMNIMTTNTLETVNQNDEGIIEAVKEIENANKDLAIVHALMMEDKYERDKITGLQEATERGKKEGIEEGIAIGKTEGDHNRQILTAKKMLEDNIEIDIISKYTGLTIEEIEKL